MSDHEKWFARPKVRFSKSAESPEKLQDVRTFGKPKIRSITNFGPRVKVLKAPTANYEFERSSSPDEIASGRSAGDAPNDLRLCPLKSASVSSPCLNEIILSPENHTSNVLKKKSPTTILTEKSIQNRTSPLKLMKKSSSHPEKILKTSVKDQKISLQTKSSGSGKENVPEARESRENYLKVPENPPRSISENATRSTISRSINLNQEKTVKKTRAEVARRVPAVARKLPEVAIKTRPESRKTDKISQDSRSAQKSVEMPSTPRPGLKTVVKLKPTIGLMPCMKIAKFRDKSAPIKKTISRDVSAGPSRVYVGPGLPRSKTPEPEMPQRQKPTRSHSEIHSGDKLKRPEYNSIVCTIKRLQEAREEKIVEDLEHLPAIYRRLINGKVSSALDFGANEAIYRDLVDLSIDEKQLPLRVMRSKDPEPRKRDIVPKLSDFFVPTNDEEYKRAVYVRPPSPRLSDIWDPYKISDRILSWKENLNS